MREIKFRARRTDTGEWVYGYICPGGKIKNNWYIVTGYDTFEIDITTLGQYTSLKDKNGKEIYEHDIVKLHKKEMLAEMIGYVIYGTYGNLCCQFVCCEQLEGGGYRNLTPYEDIEVLGNYYENPELLKAKYES